MLDLTLGSLSMKNLPSRINCTVHQACSTEHACTSKTTLKLDISVNSIPACDRYVAMMMTASSGQWNGCVAVPRPLVRI